jgi:hypothetical protein
MPKKEGAKEKAANKAQAEADARAKAAEDASWADDDKGRAKKDGKKVSWALASLLSMQLKRLFRFPPSLVILLRIVAAISVSYAGDKIIHVRRTNCVSLMRIRRVQQVGECVFRCVRQCNLA